MIEALVLAALSALAPEDPGIQLHIFSDWPERRPISGGYPIFRAEILPVRLRIANRQNATRKLDLTLRVEDSRFQVMQSVSVPGQGTFEITLPVLADLRTWRLSAGIRLEEAGRTLLTDFFSYSWHYSRSETTPVILISDAAHGMDEMQVLIASGKYAPEKGKIYILEPQSIPPHFWGAYGFARLVAVHGPALSSLSPSQKEALWKYAASGGTVALLEAPLEELLPPAIANSLAGRGQPSHVGTVYPLLLGHVSLAKPIPAASAISYFTSLTGANETQFPAPVSAFSESLWRASGWSPDEDEGTDSGMVPSYDRESGFGSERLLPILWPFRRTPITTYLLVLAGFAVVAGPLNYLFIKRLKRPLLLLLTAPGVSIAFVALLLVATILSYGTGLKEARSTFTVLDQSLGLQTTSAHVSLFSAFPPRWIHMPRDRLVLPLYGNSGHSLRLAEEQSYSGFLLPRIPSIFLAREIDSTRAMLLVSEKEGALEVTNGLGAKIRHIVVRRGGALYTAGPIEAGAAAALVPRAQRWPLSPTGPARKKPDSSLSALLWDLFHSTSDETWYDSLASLYEVPAEGDFFAAMLEISPFWSAVRGARTVAEQHIVFGMLGHAP